MSTNTPYEIEHKYLIIYPDTAMLAAKPGVEIVTISQNYLLTGPNGENRRVRSWICNGTTKYYYTEKTLITNLKRIEIEREISREEMNELLKEHDPECNTIEKTRYRYPENGFVNEVDVFPFWKKQAFLEIEVPSEETKIILPKELKVIREVTDDPAYTNHALAKQIPGED